MKFVCQKENAANLEYLVDAAFSENPMTIHRPMADYGLVYGTECSWKHGRLSNPGMAYAVFPPASKSFCLICLVSIVIAPA